jgi:hypothetical protein
MSRMRRRFVVFTALVASIAVAGEAAAQIPLSPRALGMAGAYVASARGFESVQFNPANLGLPGTPHWSIAFPQITVGSSVLGPDVSDLPDYLDYDSQDPERRQELLDKIPENGTSVDLVMRAPVASIQVGRFGVSASYAWLGEHTVGKDLVELLFEGFESGRTDYQVGNTVGTRASFWDFAAAYGRPVGPVSLGVTGHYYRGGTLVRTRAYEPEYDLLAQNISVDYVGVYSRDGSGFGVDFGAAFQPMYGLTISGAIANAFGSLDWNEELVGRSITLDNSDFQDSEFGDLEARWSDSEQDLGTTPTGQFAEVAADLDPDAWTLPRTLRLGAAWQPVRGTEVGAAYHTSMADDGEGLLGGKWDGLLGVGVQQKLPFVTVRLGASTNLDEGSMIGGGLKLGVLDLGLAKFNTRGTLTDAERDGWAASFSVNVGTRGMMR